MARRKHGNRGKKARGAARRPPAPAAAERRSGDLPPARALALPLGFSLALAAFALLPATSQNPVLLPSFLGAGGALLAWAAVLLVAAGRGGRTLSLEFVPRRPHTIQACAQLAIFVYWGWYWPQVYASAGLIAAQLLFAYAFDALLTWSRRDRWTLGFGPFPIVFSINLFLWFKPEWFYWQFVLVAAGFAAKEFLRWEKDGRRVHIFNPSSFPLAIGSVVLLATGTTHLTWGSEIAFTQLFPPHIYLLIFLVSIPGQFFFGISLMSMSAVVTSYGFVLVYAAVTGGEFFLGGFLPIASFFGMQLLFTDPATAPRSDLGRIFYGILYGASVVLAYGVLELRDQPTFYDKLLAVPILNLMVQQLDALARSKPLRRLDPAALLRGRTPERRHIVYMTAWAVVFALMQINTSGDRELARRNKLALDRLAHGRIQQAVDDYRKLARDEPGYFWGQHHLGFALIRAGRPHEAVAPLRIAGELRPDDWKTQQLLAFSLSTAGEPSAAVAHYEEALRLSPDRAEVITEFAFLLAVHPAVLDPDEAVRLATRAVELTDRRDPASLDALAAAYAASGRFEEAVRASETAEALHLAGPIPALAEKSRALGDHYRAGRPFVIPGGT